MCAAIADVCYGSKADMCGAKRHVRFTTNSDRESRHPQTVMSALPPKADMCGATRDVRYGPKADMSAPQRHVRSTRKRTSGSRVASLLSAAVGKMMSAVARRPDPALLCAY